MDSQSLATKVSGQKRSRAGPGEKEGEDDSDFEETLVRKIRTPFNLVILPSISCRVFSLRFFSSLGC